ncbi:prepilin-type N-terminal cleavage/methylation domain-containing protein [Candidatus Roizmanbacteria bacterium]|nr:prepilin-type N-terminal cleavage/methylation domain-containing protein [Candidatus Roizmanbacteria bacterium]
MRNFSRSFTLIEMLVVVAVVALALPAVFTIIFSILKQQTKIYTLQETKRQGDFLLNSIKTTIRTSAISIHSDTPATGDNGICKTAQSSAAGSSTMYFLDSLNNTFGYRLDADKVSSASSISNASGDLTNPDKVKILAFQMSCKRTGTFSPPIATISFTAQYNTTSTRPEDIASFNYQTKIQLKSY